MASLRIILVYFFPGYKVHLQLLLLQFYGYYFCSLMPNVQALSFWSESFKGLIGETHVFGRTFIFCIFLCNGGAPNLLRHVVDLSVSLNMSGPAETTQKLSIPRLHFLTLVLQCSNGFDLIPLFFQALFRLIITVYEAHVQLMLLVSLCSTGYFERWRLMFLFFLLS